MIRRVLLVLAVLAAATFTGASSAEAGGCHRGGYYGYHGYRGGYPGYYRSARYYDGYGPSYYRRSYYHGGYPGYYGGSGFSLSIGF